MAIGTKAPSEGLVEEFYDFHEKIGEGSFGSVYECVHRKTGKHYAVKVVDTFKLDAQKNASIAHEIEIMGVISYHKHIVQMIEYFVTARSLYIIMDLLKGGMLIDRIIQLKHYSERDASDLVCNMLSALIHIHSKGIIHRDLKPENLLLRYAEEDTPTPAAHLTDVCLADFGLAGYSPDTLCCGTPMYIAPEVINVGYYRNTTDPYNTNSDIWSLGIVVYILLSGKMPFFGNNFREIFKKIVFNDWCFRESEWSKVTLAAQNFIRRCLTPNPKERPTGKELLNDPWLLREQPNIHLMDSLEGLRNYRAQGKFRAAARVFFWTQNILNHPFDNTPPFMRYLEHKDKLSTIVYHKSQTHSHTMHKVDFGKALHGDNLHWRIQDCCTCTSEKVCRHIQNVHEYLFVGKLSLNVYPFINELHLLKQEAELDLEEDASNIDAKERILKLCGIIKAAYAFSEELAKVPMENRKSNLMIEGWQAMATANKPMGKSWDSKVVVGKVIHGLRADKPDKVSDQKPLSSPSMTTLSSSSKPTTAKTKKASGRTAPRMKKKTCSIC